MPVSELIDDLRGRINPAYASQLGTESHERRLCAEALETQRDRINELEGAIGRCYRMLLSEPDTKGALFKAENILREALADGKAVISRTAPLDAAAVGLKTERAKW